MPWATDGIADYKTIHEWPVIVRAVCTDGVDGAVLPNQLDFFLADQTGQHLAFGEIARGNAFGEVGSGWLLVILRHESLRARGNAPIRCQTGHSVPAGCPPRLRLAIRDAWISI